MVGWSLSATILYPTTGIQNHYFFTFLGATEAHAPNFDSLDLGDKMSESPQIFLEEPHRSIFEGLGVYRGVGARMCLTRRKTFVDPPLRTVFQ